MHVHAHVWQVVEEVTEMEEREGDRERLRDVKTSGRSFLGFKHEHTGLDWIMTLILPP